MINSIERQQFTDSGTTAKFSSTLLHEFPQNEKRSLLKEREKMVVSPELLLADNGLRERRN